MMINFFFVQRTVEIAVPSSTRRFIIGAKGATLKQIETKSNTRVNFPRKDDEDFAFNEENPDELVLITIMGDATGIRIAKEEIEKIVGEKVKNYFWIKQRGEVQRIPSVSQAYQKRINTFFLLDCQTNHQG